MEFYKENIYNIFLDFVLYDISKLVNLKYPIYCIRYLNNIKITRQLKLFEIARYTSSSIARIPNSDSD